MEMCKELSQLINLSVNFGSSCALRNVHELRQICDKFETFPEIFLLVF